MELVRAPARLYRVLSLLRPLALLLALTASLLSPVAASASQGYQLDWAVPEGFTLTVDTVGYTLPTAIAFVKRPGNAPSSPLYYVSELGGTIKVVTKDRQVRTFAKVEVPRGNEKFPALKAQTGVVGLCLDDAHGYVFATATIFDRGGVARNHLVRYETKPASFAVRPTARLDLSRIFRPFPTNPNHEMGGCFVTQGSLFVTMGDAGFPGRSHDIDYLAGKVVRMTLDGGPYPGNPFRGAGVGRYVWAKGLRNPFGITAADGDIFVTENGNEIDSFLRVRRGADYGWDGTDPTIAMNADAVIAPSVGPAHVTYDGSGLRGWPQKWARRFFFATSTGSGPRGAGVMSLRYDRAQVRIMDPPRSFIRSTRPIGGEVAAVAMGPDGLYFAGLQPNRDHKTPIYRVTYNPKAHYANVLRLATGEDLFFQYGCLECHTRIGLGGRSAPSLDEDQLRQRLSERLNSDVYRQRVAELNRRNDEPFRSFRRARNQILVAQGDDQLALWLKYRILQPRFDDPNAAMPRLGLSPSQSAEIADYLIGRGSHTINTGIHESFASRARAAVKSKRFAGGFVGGLLVAAALVVLVRVIAWQRRKSA